MPIPSQQAYVRNTLNDYSTAINCFFTQIEKHHFFDRLSIDSKIVGSSIRLEIIEINKVVETNNPKARVPPNEDAANMAKPKKRIKAVYIILKPVSRMVVAMACCGNAFVCLSSWR